MIGRTGSSPPATGARMCAYLVAYDSVSGGLLDRPRPCKWAALDGSPYCGQHKLLAAKLPAVRVQDGGFCTWCGGPAKSYSADGVTVSLCAEHGLALARAIREGR